jgi:hypothetical protein
VTRIRGGLARWREFSFLDGGLDDGLGHLTAFATLGGDAQFAANIGVRGADASSDRFFDLAVGYSFAEADVHSASANLRKRMVQKVIAMRINVNKQ